MAIAKKATPKKSETQPAKKTEEKIEEAPVEKKALKLTANKLCRELLLERRLTDDQITDKVQEVFPGTKFDKTYVSTTRIDMNKGYYKGIEEDLSTNPIIRLIEHEGKVISYDKMREIKQQLTEKEKAERAGKMLAKKKAVTTDKPIKGSAVPASEKPALKPVKKSSKKVK